MGCSGGLVEKSTLVDSMKQELLLNFKKNKNHGRI